MNNDKFLINDITDIMIIHGYGNHLGNLGLLNYSEDEITEMVITENTDEYDNARLVVSLLRTIRKQKEVIEEVREYVETKLRDVNLHYGVDNEFREEYDDLLQILDKVKDVI